MPRSWFASTDVIQLDLSEGIWIKVKKELTAGEQAKLSTASLKVIRPSRADVPAAFEVDGVAMSFARLNAYLVDWNIPGPDGKTMPVDGESIQALTVDAKAEIDAALDTYLAGQEKKVKPRSPASAAISASLGDSQ